MHVLFSLVLLAVSAGSILRKDEHGRWLIVSDMDNSNRRRE